ncbi:hypothetical protein [Pseudomonas sp. NFACC05-1]|uniref:hypothetical protein n=1 Tax=Pseudomonas sp. NFACC05-1 TaxID=1566241 RepID=UPI0008714E88|nr:hypothetical protein [Pseudomonas sp. NFACC05-1]SCW88666.1 hypothetical protein SAMN03159424_03947 [Pseudomonas sp. NFACC05-1]
MRILLSPQRRDDVLEVIKSGDVLTINGEDFDLSPIGDGDTLPREAIASIWFAGPVDRIEGELVLTLLFPNPWNYSQEQAFPAPLENVPNGPVALPGPLPMQVSAPMQEDAQ